VSHRGNAFLLDWQVALTDIAKVSALSTRVTLKLHHTVRARGSAVLPRGGGSGAALAAARVLPCESPTTDAGLPLRTYADAAQRRTRAGGREGEGGISPLHTPTAPARAYCPHCHTGTQEREG
jgi:hypothetical protein